MTQRWFENEDPTRRVEGGGIGVLYDSGSQTIVGLNIGYISTEGTELVSVLRQCNSVRFSLSGSYLDANITSRRSKDSYMNFVIDPPVYFSSGSLFSLLATGSLSEEGTSYISSSSDVILVPYLSVSFYYSDYNPLQNVVVLNQKDVTKQVVDNRMNQVVPTNLEAIISGSAEKAQVQFSNYTKLGTVAGRYEGTKLTSVKSLYLGNKQLFVNQVSDIQCTSEKDNPVLTLYSFMGSIHPTGSIPEAIWDTSLSAREYITLYLGTEEVGEGNSVNYLPVSGSVLYTNEVGNRFARVTNRMVFSVDSGFLYTTNELGRVHHIDR